jgi:hypothetical protein
MGTVIRENTSMDSGYGGGGYAAGWGMGAGILFLVLFLIILFGVAWSRDGHRDSRETFRSHFETMGRDSDHHRGELREILTNSIRNNERVNDIWSGTRELIQQSFNSQRQIEVGLERARGQVELGLERVGCAVGDGARLSADTTRREADRILERGLTFGFRTFDIVRPDPCRDVCRDRDSSGGRNGNILDVNTGTQIGNGIGGALTKLGIGSGTQTG